MHCYELMGTADESIKLCQFYIISSRFIGSFRLIYTVFNKGSWFCAFEHRSLEFQAKSFFLHTFQHDFIKSIIYCIFPNILFHLPKFWGILVQSRLFMRKPSCIRIMVTLELSVIFAHIMSSFHVDDYGNLWITYDGLITLEN